MSLVENYSLLAVSTPSSINIGDYIQALASKQFLPKVDSYIEREHLKDYDGVETNMIMNAYYMHDGSQWPPSSNINPLFVAVHINKLVQNQMLSEEGIRYFKQHEPIGCRDLETERVLKACGVDSYFSGCMTLTLGRNYKTGEKNGKVYFVDVRLPIKGRKEQLVLMIKSLFYFNLIKTIAKKMSYTKHSKREMLGAWIRSAKLYFSFRRLTGDSLLTNAEYLTQEDEMYNQLSTNDARISAAEELVMKYARASLVVTSRIHCALPCIAVETPVYYVYDNNMPYQSKCRLDGLVQLFNVIYWDGKHLTSDIIKKISLDTIVPNKDDYKKYSSRLIRTCESFINSCKK